jgi:crotonobetaine/carnitine-CoA ligase
VVVLDAPDERSDLPFDVVRADRLIDTSEPAHDLDEPEVWDVSCLIYTSGTTGPSKGVLVPWGELHNLCSAAPDDFLAPGDAYYSIYPAFHVSGKSSLYVAALHSAHVVFRETLSVTDFWGDVRAHEVRAAGLVGPIASLLLLMPPQPDDADNPLDRILIGPVIPQVEEFKRRFGVAHVTTGYGMTEIGAPVIAGWDPPLNGTCGKRRIGPPGFEVKIVDEHDRTVPVGQVGELVVRSYEPWAMNLGYWRDPEQSQKAWRNGWFHTGDGFREDEDGWLYFVDRMKDALRRRGENISSFEVEAGVAEHPAVAECAVIGVPSEVGEDEVKVIIVRKRDMHLEPADLIEFLIPRMPRFMIPRYVEFVDELPKTDATLRVRKVELRAEGVNGRTWDRDAAGITLPRD